MYEVKAFDSPTGNSIEQLTQWDTNRTIYIKNWDYKVEPIFHICNTKSKNSYTLKGEIIDGCASTTIPNELLQQHFPILIYVYFEDDFTEDGLDGEAYGRTVFYTNIPVRKKPRPYDYCYQESVEYMSWIRLEKSINHRVEKIINYAKFILHDYETALSQLEAIRDETRLLRDDVANNYVTKSEHQALKNTVNELYERIRVLEKTQ